MIKGHTIFILSLMKFDGPASTNFTIAKYLAKENDVYYIEHPLSIKDYIKIDKQSPEYQIRKEGYRLGANGLLKDKVEGVNIVVAPPIIPSHSLKSPLLNKLVTALNQKLTLHRIKRVIKYLRVKDFIFINAYDFKLPDIGVLLRPRLSVYYCVDPIPDYDKPVGTLLESRLITQSDIVICTSKALFEEKKKNNPNTYFVPNGADIVTESGLRALAAHPKLQALKTPVVGYVGAVERRIDYELINQVSAALSYMTFVFVGPVFKEHVPDWFWNRQNIVYLEPIPYVEVPAAIKAFDVCMIPFKKDEISNNIFPLKLFEYLGLGKPVVATDFNMDLAEYSEGLVRFAANAEAFQTALHAAVSDGESRAAERLAVAAKNTWQHRVARISEIIEQHLALGSQQQRR